jgi:hypothetical protein
MLAVIVEQRLNLAVRIKGRDKASDKETRICSTMAWAATLIYWREADKTSTANKRAAH